MESLVSQHLNNMTQLIKDDLNKLVRVSCQAKCANGKQCKFAALTNSKCCKKHSNVVINDRNVPDLVYHNHLPGHIHENCPACKQSDYTVGINS